MAEMGQFLVNFVNLLFTILMWAIIARSLLSWFRLAPDHPIIRVLDDVTEPILAPLRRVIPLVGPLDISPIVAIILLNVAQTLLVRALSSGAF
ncbi:MAG: YggT family protein [Chloroflexi bacterium]|nr:YggT family protein [Chloroflexota bacterium]